MRWVVVAVALSGCAAVQSRPSLESHRRAGDEAFERGDLDEAARHYDALIARAPKLVSMTTLGRRAAVYYLQDDYDGVVAFVDDIALPLARDPRYLYEYRALALWKLGRRDDAIADALRATSGRPSSYKAQLLIGTHYADSDPVLAAAAYAAYFAHRPQALAHRDARPRLALGGLFLRIGEPRRAAAQYRLAARASPDDRAVAAKSDAGLCAATVAMGNHRDAVDLCRRVAEDPVSGEDIPSALFNLGRAYLVTKHPRDALATAERYVQLAPAP